MFCNLYSYTNLLVSESIFQAICENKFVFIDHLKLNSITQNNEEILTLLFMF
jgi:hypothetical protein